MRPASRALRTWGYAVVGLAALLPAGCGVHSFWDRATSRDLTWQQRLWSSDEPMDVIVNSTDYAKKGKALATLREPKDPQERERYFNILSAVLTNPQEPMYRQPICRLGALKALGSYHDDQAVRLLENAYLQPLRQSIEPNASVMRFTTEMDLALRLQTLASLEETGNPEARKLIIDVAKQPPSTGSSVERQQVNDERMQAIRALAQFKQWDSVDALLYVLKNEKDVGLKHAANDSLENITGKSVATADEKAWRDVLNSQPASGGGQGSAIERVMWWNRPKESGMPRP